MIPKRAGFTLIEVLVVVAILGILAGVVAFAISDARESGRDSERQAKLRLVEAALVNYYRDHGRYPAGCNGANNWSGQNDGSFACADITQEYIVGLAPDYISALPKDPKLNGNGSGYVYTTNGAGTVYKFMAMNTVESETVTDQHELSSCDVIHTEGSEDIDRAGWCSRVFNEYATPNQCQPSSNRYRTSYAVWGGVAPERTSGCPSNPNSSTYKPCRIQDTTSIICK